MATLRQQRIGSTTMTTAKVGTVANTEEAWAAAIVQREGVLESGKIPLSIAMGNRNLDDVQADRWGKWVEKHWKSLNIKSTGRQLVLREVNFSGNSLTSMGVRCILSALKRIQVNVQVLKFFQNRIESARDVIEFLTWNEGNLRELHLSHNRLDTASARDIILGVATAVDSSGAPFYPFPSSKQGVTFNVPLWLRLEGNVLNAGNLQVELLAALSKIGRPLKSVVCEVDNTSPCHTMLCKMSQPPAVHLTYLNMATTAPTQQARGLGAQQPIVPPTGPAARSPAMMKAKAAAAAAAAAAKAPGLQAPPSKSGGSVWGGPAVSKAKPQPPSSSAPAALAASGSASASAATQLPTMSATAAWLDGSSRPEARPKSAGPPTKAKPPPPRDPPSMAEAAGPPAKVLSKAPAVFLPQGTGSSTPEALSSQGEDETESDRGSFEEALPPVAAKPPAASAPKQAAQAVSKKAKAPPPEDPLRPSANHKASAKAKSKAPAPSPDPLVSSAAAWMAAGSDDPAALDVPDLPPPDMAPPLRPQRASTAAPENSAPLSVASLMARSSLSEEGSVIFSAGPGPDPGPSPGPLVAATSAPPGLSFTETTGEEALPPSSPPPPKPSALLRSVSAFSTGSALSEKLLPPAPLEAPPCPPSELPPPPPEPETRANLDMEDSEDRSEHKSSEAPPEDRWAELKKAQRAPSKSQARRSSSPLPEDAIPSGSRRGRREDPKRQAITKTGAHVTVTKHSSMGCAVVSFAEPEDRSAVLRRFRSPVGEGKSVAHIDGISIDLKAHTDKASHMEVPTDIFAAWGRAVEKATPLSEERLVAFFEDICSQLSQEPADDQASSSDSAEAETLEPQGVDRQTSGLEEVVNLQALSGAPGLGAEDLPGLAQMEEPPAEIAEPAAAAAAVEVEKQMKVVVTDYKAEAPGYLSVTKGAKIMVYADVRAPGDANCAHQCYIFGESFDQASDQGWLPEEVAWERYTDASSGRVWLYQPLTEGFMWEDDLFIA